MKEWSHEVRVLGNESAHPKPGAPPTTEEDVKSSHLRCREYNLAQVASSQRREAALPSGPAQVKNSPPKNFCKYIPGARLHDSARLRVVVEVQYYAIAG